MKDFFPILAASPLFSGVTENELDADAHLPCGEDRAISQGRLSPPPRRRGRGDRHGALRLRARRAGGYLGQPQHSLPHRTGADLRRGLRLRAKQCLQCERRDRNADGGAVFERQAPFDGLSLRLRAPQPHHPKPSERPCGKNLLLNEKLTHIAQRTTRAKLMSYLSAEAQRRGAVEFDIPFSRQQLADFLSVERSGLSLELGKMKKEGLLDYHKEHFVLNI